MSYSIITAEIIMAINVNFNRIQNDTINDRSIIYLKADTDERPTRMSSLGRDRNVNNLYKEKSPTERISLLYFRRKRFTSPAKLVNPINH